MPQRQWRSDDTDKWVYGFGSGVDGNLTISTDTTDAPIDSACSGTSGTKSLTATNASFAAGQLVMIHQTRGTGAGSWELNRISSYTAGTITLTHNLMNTYTNSGSSVAQVIVLKQYQNVTINSGKTLTAKAWNGTVGGIAAFLVNNVYSHAGLTTTDGKGFQGSAASLRTDNYGYMGEGTGGAIAFGTSLSGNGNGGGSPYIGNNSNYSASGAGGGNATAGGSGEAYTSGPQPAQGGTAAGNADLTSMVFGGGGSGAVECDTPSLVTAGANGAGIVLIIARSIVVTGTITANGNSTANAPNTNDWALGGGGAGGSILMKCQSFSSTNTINALKGTGGKKITSRCSGGDGSVGRIHIDYSSSYSASGSISPAADVRVDSTIVPPSSGSFIFNLL